MPWKPRMGQGWIPQHNIMGVGRRKEATGLGSLGSPWVRNKIKRNMTVLSLSQRGHQLVHGGRFITPFETLFEHQHREGLMGCLTPMIGP